MCVSPRSGPETRDLWEQSSPSSRFVWNGELMTTLARSHFQKVAKSAGTLGFLLGKAVQSGGASSGTEQPSRLEDTNQGGRDVLVGGLALLGLGHAYNLFTKKTAWWAEEGRLVIGGGREEHFVIRPSRIDVIIFSSVVLLATDSCHLNSVGIPVDLIKLLKMFVFG